MLILNQLVYITIEKEIIMTDTEYLNNKYGQQAWYSGYHTYVQSVYDPVQTHALYGVPTDKVDDWKARLKQNKGITRFRIVRANCKAWSIICFKYNEKKDQFRHPELIKK